MQNAPIPRHSLVPLKDKLVPTELVPEENHDQLICAAFRGNHDISPLKNFCLSLEEEKWGEEYNKTNNVLFLRPFHDRLGVNKIICMFSDNHLKQVYHLPVWHQNKELQEMLQKLFSKIGVSQSKVVRCLFAKLPPNTLIPPHHDNGSWVSKTHRIHVPIVTHEDVVFKSGPLENTMHRYAFNEGTIIELNNAAKHSVHNQWDGYRIHLIFDYVEDDVINPPILLKPGQLCRQVRGRIYFTDKSTLDEEKHNAKKGNEMLLHLLNYTEEEVDKARSDDLKLAIRQYFIEMINASEFVAEFLRIFSRKSFNKHSSEVYKLAKDIVLEMFQIIDPIMNEEVNVEFRRREEITWQLPGFIIIGSQKSGTTALYQYISQHPDAVKGNRREPHFFDWKWESLVKYKLNTDQKNACNAILEREDCYNLVLDKQQQEMKMKYLLSLDYPNLSDLSPPIVIGESTPSYLLYGKPVAERIKNICPNICLIVMLRNPVARAYSHFQMTADSVGTPSQLKKREAVKGKSFDELVGEDMKLLKTHGVDLNGNFQKYADSLPVDHGCHSYIGRGLYALQLELWFSVFPRDQILILNLEAMKTPRGAQDQCNKVFRFIGLPEYIVKDTEPKNTREYNPIPAEIEKALQEFYRPYNEKLYDLIGEKFDW